MGVPDVARNADHLLSVLGIFRVRHRDVFQVCPLADLQLCDVAHRFEHVVAKFEALLYAGRDEDARHANVVSGGAATVTAADRCAAGAARREKHHAGGQHGEAQGDEQEGGDAVAGAHGCAGCAVLCRSSCRATSFSSWEIPPSSKISAAAGF